MTEFENNNLEPEQTNDMPDSSDNENNTNPESPNSLPGFPDTPQDEEPLNRTSLSRHIIQVISFVLFPALFFTLLSGIADIIIAISNDRFSLAAMSGKLILTGGIFIITILWGRFFCGYICALGAVSDLMYYLSEKILPDKWRIKEPTDKRLKYLKYLVLLLFVLVILLTATPLVSYLGLEQSVIPFSFGHGRFMHIGTRIALLLLILFLAGSFFIERFFCRYLCPLGALFTPLSKLRLFHVNRELEHCSMGILKNGKEKVTSGECINCMGCVSCSKEKDIPSQKKSPVFTGIAVSVIIAIVVTASQFFGLPDKNDIRSAHESSDFSYGKGPDRNNMPDSGNSDFGKNKNNNPDNNDNNSNDRQEPDTNQAPNYFDHRNETRPDRRNKHSASSQKGI